MNQFNKILIALAILMISMSVKSQDSVIASESNSANVNKVQLPPPNKWPKNYGDPFPGSKHKHLAIDFTVPYNDPIIATGDGEVLVAHNSDTRLELPPGDRMQPWGKHVIIKHGGFFGFVSIYQHLSSVSVKVGDKIKRGQEIGKNGDSGSQGPGSTLSPAIAHVHLEFSRDPYGNNRFNPMDYIVGCFDATKKYEEKQHTYPVICKE
jgi:murein DD-endopeptidase MepM/ murein hydrolase activator NlpD